MPPSTIELWTVEDHSVALTAQQCGLCGLVQFPPQQYGCPGCGALPEQLKPQAVAAVGRLHSFAVVNRHPKYATPFTVGEVELDAGPLVRGLLADGQDLAVNDRVAAQSEERDGQQTLVFSAVEEK